MIAHVYLLRPGCCQQGARTFLLKIYIRNIIILCIWAQAFTENTGTKKPTHQNYTPCVSEPNSFITDDHCFLLVSYIINYQFCIQKPSLKSSCRFVLLMRLCPVNRKGYRVCDQFL